MAIGAQLDAQITDAAMKHGVDPALLKRIVQIESSGNPLAQTGKYKGLGQFSDAEWAKYGKGGNIWDANANANALAAKVAAESQSFQAKTGRAPTPIDIYMQHQQGPAGAVAHAANPEGIAWQNVAKYYSSPAIAKKAIWGNMTPEMKAQFPGGVDTVTSGDFTGGWDKKLGMGNGPSSPSVATQPGLVASANEAAPVPTGATAEAKAPMGGGPAPAVSGGSSNDTLAGGMGGDTLTANGPLSAPADNSKLAEELMKSGMTPSTAPGWGTTIGKMAQILSAGVMQHQQQKRADEYNAQLAKLLSGTSSPESMGRAMLMSGNPALMQKGAEMIAAANAPKSAPTIISGPADAYGRPGPQQVWNPEAINSRGGKGAYEPLSMHTAGAASTPQAPAAPAPVTRAPSSAQPAMAAPAPSVGAEDTLGEQPTAAPTPATSGAPAYPLAAPAAGGSEPVPIRMKNTVQLDPVTGRPLAEPQPATPAQGAPTAAPAIPPGYTVGPPVPKVPADQVQKLAPGGAGFLYDASGTPIFENKSEVDTRAKLAEKKADTQAEARQQVEGVSGVIADARKLSETPGFGDALRINQRHANINVPTPWGPIGGNMMEPINSAVRAYDPQNPAWSARDDITATQQRLNLLVARPLMKGQGQVTESERASISDAIGNLSNATSKADYQFKLNSVQRMINDMNSGSGVKSDTAAQTSKPTNEELQSLIDNKAGTFNTDKMIDLSKKYNVHPLDMQDYLVDYAKRGAPHNQETPAPVTPPTTAQTAPTASPANVSYVAKEPAPAMPPATPIDMLKTIPAQQGAGARTPPGMTAGLPQADIYGTTPIAYQQSQQPALPYDQMIKALLGQGASQ